jgi:hypothetical protein
MITVLQRRVNIRQQSLEAPLNKATPPVNASRNVGLLSIPRRYGLRDDSDDLGERHAKLVLVGSELDAVLDCSAAPCAAVCEESRRSILALVPKNCRNPGR